MATRGYAASEVERVYARCRELFRQAGEPPRLFPALWGVWAFQVNSVRGAQRTASGLAAQLLRLARRAGDPALRLEADFAEGVSAFWLGKPASARRHLEHGSALYDPARHASLARLYGGHDPGVACRSLAAWILWLLGYPDQALERAREALALARELAHPFSEAFALAFVGWVHRFRREVPAAGEHAEVLIKLAAEQGFAWWAAAGTLLRGWVLAEEGRVDDGIATMREGLAVWRAAGAAVAVPYYLAWLAEACGKAGRVEESLALCDDALAMARKSGERVWHAEVYRVRGELLGRTAAAAAQAEGNLRQAATIARQQRARSLDLRAAVSLGRLWQRQGKRTRARQALAGVYGWFTEGFGTGDLRDAQTLLAELSP